MLQSRLNQVVNILQNCKPINFRYHYKNIYLKYIFFNKSFYKANHIKCINYKYNILTIFYDNISLPCKEHIDHLNVLYKKMMVDQ
jgi:hypothetical protein